MLPFANNITVATKLAVCSPWINASSAVLDLYDLYRSNVSRLVSSVFHNVSIPHVDCTSGYSKYFEQMIFFTSSVPVRVQVALASIYFDYVNNNSYAFNGFGVSREASFNITSITVNDTAQFDACASGETAQDPLCGTNSLTPVCFEPTPNPWKFNCSQFTTTSTLSTTTTTTTGTTSELRSTTAATGLTPWQVGLIAGFGSLLLLVLLVLLVYGIRRYSRKRRVIHLDGHHLAEATKAKLKSGIPEGQAFQRSATLVQPRRTVITSILPIQDGLPTGPNARKAHCISIKPAGLHHQGTFIDHAKIHDPVFSLKTPVPSAPKGLPSTTVSRPVSGTSVVQLRSITDALEEHGLDESDSISLDRSNSTNPKKPSTPVSRQFVDESLHDEDAWMPILAVANAELDVLNRLEHVQHRIKTLIHP